MSPTQETAMPPPASPARPLTSPGLGAPGTPGLSSAVPKQAGCWAPRGLLALFLPECSPGQCFPTSPVWVGVGGEGLPAGPGAGDGPQAAPSHPAVGPRQAPGMSNKVWAAVPLRVSQCLTRGEPHPGGPWGPWALHPLPPPAAWRGAPGQARPCRLHGSARKPRRGHRQAGSQPHPKPEPTDWGGLGLIPGCGQP